MRRLVYAPKVWIFIRASNLNGQIFDVSSDIVRGSVTQNLGDVSKARFELRNRGWKWTKFKSEDGEKDRKQVFLPMDLCTIWMQRIAGRPVQVFTGYLDSVPYYQAYPGTAIFEATCTLKKLAFNWFDPGLVTFSNWLKDNGWTYDRNTGQAIVGPVGPADPNTGLGQSGASIGRAVSDVNMGQLIGRFMVDIAGWDPNDVVIGNLSVDVAVAADKLKAQLDGEFAQARSQPAEFLGAFLGIHGAEGFSASPEESTLDKTKDSHDRNKEDKNLPTVTKVVATASRSNVPPWIAIFAGLLASAFNPTRQVKRETGDPNWGFGLYSMRPTSQITTADGKVIHYIDGQPISNVLDSGVATDIFARRLNSNTGEASKKAVGSNDATAAVEWINKALGFKLKTDGVNLQAVFLKANQLAGTQASSVPEAFPKNAVKPSETPPSSPVVQKQLTDEEKKLVNSYYKDLEPEMGFVILVAKNFSKSLTLQRSTNSLSKNQIYIKAAPAVLQGFFNSLKGNKAFNRVEMFANGENQTMQDGVPKSGLPSSLKDIGIVLTGNIAELKKLKEVLPFTQDPIQGLPEGIDNQEAGLTMQQLAIFAANSAFAANFAFDSNAYLAQALVGEKALMNDTSCLDAVKQFCQASLRTFRSLPDGRFMAFYPDYFGSTREPYWTIRDIETIDFGIQLNDQALATHVYIIGDQIMGSTGAGLDPEVVNQVYTEGVATITQANMLDSFIARGNEADDGLTRLQQAASFLEHYGARPHKEAMPIIRNRDYEFLMAWQKFQWLWAQQFATTVQFTFQPEVMAGGLILFSDHDVQMFCESVTHNFDYTAGFTTQAVLTAPSLAKGGDKSAMPGFALAGGINTVGAG